MSSLARTFERAMKLHQQGNFSQAESLYREILRSDPRHADALHFLGVLSHQTGKNEQAVEYIQKALQLKPRYIEAFNNFANILKHMGRLEEARTRYLEALRLKPDFPEALYNLGDTYAALGRLDEAIDYYRKAIRQKPNYDEAHTNLGNALRRQGKFEEALNSYGKVPRLRPEMPGIYNNIGSALKEQGKTEEATANFREAIRLQPDYPDAYINLGSICHEQGQFEEALNHYRKALQLKPDHAALHNNLGALLSDLGKPQEAIAHYRQAVHINPAFPEAHANLGNALRDQGKLDEASASYRQALQLKPNLFRTHSDLGSVLKEQGKWDEASTSYREAIRIKPDFLAAHNSLGNLLRERGNLVEAMASFRQALQIKPDSAEALNNLGNAFKDQGKLAEASDCYEQAIRANPGYSLAYYHLGIVRLEQKKPEEAIGFYRQALTLNPGFAEAHNNLGSVLKAQGLLAEAIASFRQAIALKPAYVAADDNLLLALHYHPDYDSTALLREAQRWNEIHARPLERTWLPHGNSPDPERRLKIGYVSPDFCNHPVGHLLVPLLSAHDHSRVEVLCYAEVARPDELTARLRPCADIWRSTVGLGDEAVADMIRADQVDILVDLAMHTANNRLLVFARKPAPVQVTWLGYPGTTGLSAIDYRLSDPFLDPSGGNDGLYSEETIRLPDTFWCYHPCTDQPEVNELPALATGLITFGCLNTFCKLNRGVLELWCRVLRAIPRSRLLLLAPRGQPRENVLEIIARQGVDEARVEFTDRLPRQQYLQLYQRIDLGLDPWPYNGHTTSLDAFWMGVPTITLVGPTIAGRGGWSQLSNLGLTELAARTPDDFVSLAVELAADLPRLQELRGGLRGRMQASPLMNGQRLASNMEEIYRQIWHRLCQKVKGQ